MDAQKIGVVIPAYNAEDTIERCIHSVKMQNYTNWEIFVVNDGSKDSTGIILDNLKETDKRIHVIHIENGGKRNAHKIGIAAAIGCDFITFLDSDDEFITRNLFGACIKEGQQVNADIVSFNLERNGKPVFKIKNKVVFCSIKEKAQNMLNQRIMDGNLCGAFYRYDIVYAGYRLSEYNHEDYVNKFEFLKRAKNVLIMPIVGYRYYKQQGSITQKNIIEDDYFYYLHAQEFVNRILRECPELKEASDYFLGNIILWTAEKLCQNKENKKLTMYYPIMEKLIQYRNIILKENQYFTIKRKVLCILIIYKLYYPMYKLRNEMRNIMIGHN